MEHPWLSACAAGLMLLTGAMAPFAALAMEHDHPSVHAVAPLSAQAAHDHTVAGATLVAAGKAKAGAARIAQAAEAGYAPARLLLGTLYLEGRGVQQDDHRASVLFNDAAPKLREARFNLGVMIAAGRGFALDDDGVTRFSDGDTGEVYQVDVRARRQVAFMTMVGAAMKGGLSVDVGRRMAAIMDAQKRGLVVPEKPMELIIGFDDLVTDNPATSPFLTAPQVATPETASP